jgi:hypothetical protein
MYICSGFRRSFRDVVTVMSYDDSSDSSNSSSDEEDLDLLFVDVAFGEGCVLDSRPNILDFTEIECEEMFRYSSFLFYSISQHRN